MTLELRIAELAGRLSRIEDLLCKTMGERADIETNLHALIAQKIELLEISQKLAVALKNMEAIAKRRMDKINAMRGNDDET